jgi:hypothetical protein
MCHTIALIEGEHAAVTKMPENFTRWQGDNADRIEAAKDKGTLPSFLRDNDKEVKYNNKSAVHIYKILDDIIKQNGKNTYVAFEPFSPMITEYLNKLRTNKQRQQLFQAIIKDDAFKVLFKGDINTGTTFIHPLHQGQKKSSWTHTQQMAKEINKTGESVTFLPEKSDKSYADAIVKIKGKWKIADFKYSSTTKWNTLQYELKESFLKQADSIVLKLEKIDAGQFRETIEYLKRNNYKLGNIKLINKYGKVLDLDVLDLKTGKYKKKIKAFL